MRSIEEIVRTILNSDALMEKVNHVVEIERMKYNRGWSTETDIDNFSPIGFRKVVTSAMNLLGLPNESGEVDIAWPVLRQFGMCVDSERLLEVCQKQKNRAERRRMMI